MEKDIIIDDANSVFVNVTISAKRISGKYPLSDLKKASEGWWLMNPKTAENIKYVFPVKSNQILGVFEVVGMESAPDLKTRAIRVKFDLKMIFEGSTQLLDAAVDELVSTTHFVTKYFKI